jgi:hypothetical protein
LQLGVEYGSRAEHREDGGLTVGRRQQRKVLAGDDNIKGDRNKKTCRLVTSNCTQMLIKCIRDCDIVISIVISIALQTQVSC